MAETCLEPPEIVEVLPRPQQDERRAELRLVTARNGLVDTRQQASAAFLVTDTLVGSLETFADKAHLSQFFVAAVIVAIVGNAAEHGSAVLLARRGNVELATEIALASSAQVAAFLIPVVALVSWAIHPLALSLRPVELVALGGATLLASVVLARGRTTHAGGAVLLSAYTGLVIVFYLAGDR